MTKDPWDYNPGKDIMQHVRREQREAWEDEMDSLKRDGLPPGWWIIPCATLGVVFWITAFIWLVV